MIDTSLFPKQEEWATGDEAVDSKLSRALASTIHNLSFQSIKEFNSLALGINLRLYNPSYKNFIDLVTRALLFHLSPNEANDELLTKLQGNYFLRDKKIIEIKDKNLIFNELTIQGHSRYKNELDFYYRENQLSGRNPFLKELIKNSRYEISAKILMKDFKNYLQGNELRRIETDPLLLSLRDPNVVTVIEGIGEFWFFEEKIFAISLI